MPVYEVMDLQQGRPLLGDWSVNFSPTTKMSVRLAAYRWDTIVITPTRWRGPLTRTMLLPRALYSGRIYKRKLRGPKDGWSYSGNSILSWLGDHDNPMKGNLLAINIDIGVTLTSLVTTLLGGTAGGGLTLGSTTGLSANLLGDRIDGWEAARQLINRQIKMTTVPSEYHVFPDGTVGFSARGDSYVFRQTPNVLIARDLPPESSANLIRYNATRLECDDDHYDFATLMSYYGKDIVGSGTTAGIGGVYNFGGTSAPAWEKHAEPQLSVDGPALLTAMESQYVDKTAHDLSVDAFAFSGDVKTGDHVWIWDPYTGLSDPANTIGHMHPKKVRVSGIRWPIKQGMGVYVLHNSTATGNVVEDLTDYVVFETGDTKVEFGASPDSLRSSANGGSPPLEYVSY